MSIKPHHQTSLAVSKELVKGGILFPESLVVWINGFICETYSKPVTVMSTPTIVLRKHWHGEFSLEVRDNLYAALKTPHKGVGIIPAPNLNEILDELPEGTNIIKWHRIKYHCYCNKEHLYKTGETANTAPDAAALMLIKLKGKEVSHGL